MKKKHEETVKESQKFHKESETEDVDEQIKYMTNVVQSSLEEIIASRLEHLKTFENELENFT